MFRTLQSRLMLFFLLISLSGIILVSITIHFSFFQSFREYLETKRFEKVETVVERIEYEYLNNGRATGRSLDAIIHNYAMTEHLFFIFYDQDGSVVFDSTIYSRMMRGMPNGGMMNNYDFESLEKEDFPVSIDNLQIGSLVVYYPLKYVEIDSQFLEQFKKHIILAVIIMIVFSIFISFLVSKKLTFPLRQVSNGAKQLQNHNLSVRVPEENGVEELNQLASSFNELADSLAKQEKLRKQFTNDLAHELRTPLATLRSQIEAFVDEVWEPTPERLKQGHNELMRLVRLVDELEQLLSAENPNIQLHLSEINVKSVLQSLKLTFQQPFHEKKISFEVIEPQKDIYFNVDHDRLLQILINILNNALKYTERDGTVIMRTECTDEIITFIVKDNGKGISEADFPHIFERFYRGEKSRNRSTGGVGIGLAIVKALVEAHGGEISIKSKEDQGTEVSVSIKL